MTRRTRTILFIFIVLLFFLIAPLIILYSQGYRFDFENKKFFQTGAFSFKVWPQGAWVSVDGKLTKKATFPFGAIYIANLSPKKYTVEIKKEGYFPWEKTLEIKEELVTENKNIFLVPENVQFTFLEKDVGRLFLSPDGKEAILKKDKTAGWILFLLDMERNVLTSLFEEKDFSEKDERVNFKGIKWSLDSKKILVETLEGEYFIVEIDGKPVLLSLFKAGSNVNNISFSPNNSQRIFFGRGPETKNNLFSLDYQSKEISGPILNKFLSFELLNNNLFWLDDQGFLRQFDFAGNEIRQLNREPFSLNVDFQYRLFPFAEDKIFLVENNKLYFFNQDDQLLEKISDNIKDLKISPDLKKIVYFTDYEIWVLFLEKIEGQPQRTKGEKIFLARFSEKIGDVFWWTNHYLVFLVGDTIKIAEIDNRDRVNVYDLGKFNNPEIFWNKYNKKIYILSQGDLFSSKKLLP